MIETDVIVVGSGPAGSSAAKHAALGGAKVILMDKITDLRFNNDYNYEEANL